MGNLQAGRAVTNADRRHDGRGGQIANPRTPKPVPPNSVNGETAAGRFAWKSNPAARGLRCSIVGEATAEAERVLAGAVDVYQAALGKRLLAAYQWGALRMAASVRW